MQFFSIFKGNVFFSEIDYILLRIFQKIKLCINKIYKTYAFTTFLKRFIKLGSFRQFLIIKARFLKSGNPITCLLLEINYGTLLIIYKYAYIQYL